MNIEAVLSYVGTLLWSGWTSLRDYLAAHVLLCLVMAFIIAGYMSTMIPKEVITRYLGSKAPRVISYSVAAIGGFILAVCSCTILPLFAGIWKRGAGLGAAITFLFGRQLIYWRSLIREQQLVWTLRSQESFYQ